MNKYLSRVTLILKIHSFNFDKNIHKFIIPSIIYKAVAANFQLKHLSFLKTILYLAICFFFFTKDLIYIIFSKNHFRFLHTEIFYNTCSGKIFFKILISPIFIYITGKSYSYFLKTKNNSIHLQLIPFLRWQMTATERFYEKRQDTSIIVENAATLKIIVGVLE